MQKRTWYWIIAAIVIILAIYLFMGKGTETATAPTTPAATAPATTAPATPEPAAPAPAN